MKTWFAFLPIVALLVALVGCAKPIEVLDPSTKTQTNDQPTSEPQIASNNVPQEPGKSASGASPTATSSEPSPGESSTERKPVEQAPQSNEIVFDGTAEELGKAFAEDEAEAREKYLGRLVIVSGQYFSRAVDARHLNYLRMVGTPTSGPAEVKPPIPEVYSHFKPREGYDALNSLYGRPVKIKGRITDFSSTQGKFIKQWPAVKLDDAEVVQLGPQPVKIELKTIAGLNEEFRTGPELYYFEYKNRAIALQGTVLEKTNFFTLLSDDSEPPNMLVVGLAFGRTPGEYDESEIPIGKKIKVYSYSKKHFSATPLSHKYFPKYDQNRMRTMIENAWLWLEEENDPTLKYHPK